MREEATALEVTEAKAAVAMAIEAEVTAQAQASVVGQQLQAAASIDSKAGRGVIAGIMWQQENAAHIQAVESAVEAARAEEEIVRQALATAIQAGRTEEEQSLDDDSSKLAGVKVATLVVGQQLETAASTDSTELQETAIAIGIDIASSAIAEAIASVVGQLKEGAANTKTIGPRWTRTQYRRMRRRRVLV